MLVPRDKKGRVLEVGDRVLRKYGGWLFRSMHVRGTIDHFVQNNTEAMVSGDDGEGYCIECRNLILLPDASYRPEGLFNLIADYQPISYAPSKVVEEHGTAIKELTDRLTKYTDGTISLIKSLSGRLNEVEDRISTLLTTEEAPAKVETIGANNYWCVACQFRCGSDECKKCFTVSDSAAKPSEFHFDQLPMDIAFEVDGNTTLKFSRSVDSASDTTPEVVG